MEQQNADYGSTILIIDDDAINRKILAKIFSDIYAIKEVSSGSAGLSEILMNRQNYCAILLDVVMPGMNGIEVLQHLKKMKILDTVPVFLITAEHEDEMEREAYRLGVMDVIIKPVIPYLVRRRVQSVIELFSTRKYLHSVIDQQKSELLRQTDKIIQLNRGMIEALATAIEFRNGESGEHVNRVFSITKFMLENTEFGEGLSPEEINNIALASIMHDVGKIAIPDAILTKQGRLTPEEYAIMQTHTIQGEILLKSISQIRDTEIYRYACDIARHHHERWDGGGYPDHLKEEAISPWAQIVSLADVYDALSCKRVYKEAFSRGKVLETIWAGKCGAFNPHLLDCFFAVEDRISEIYQAVV